MAVKALTLSAVATITSKTDEAYGTPEATQFTIGALDAFVSSYMFDRTLSFSENDAGVQTAMVKMNEANIEGVRFGLKGWSNFKDDKGNDVEFKTVEKFVMGRKFIVVSDECLALMDLPLLRELAVAIRNINEVKPADAVKSVAP